MKKLLVLLSIVILALSLTACGETRVYQNLEYVESYVAPHNLTIFVFKSESISGKKIIFADDTPSSQYSKILIEGKTYDVEASVDTITKWGEFIKDISLSK